MDDFYDRMAGLYHLIFQNWDESIERQARQLTCIIREQWGEKAQKTLDASCGIGTQSLGLAQQGFLVTASDISEAAIARAKEEARVRSVEIDISICDMREAHNLHQQEFDVVISCDNSMAHLLSNDDLLVALRQFYQCVRPGGGCLLTVRDYDREERGAGLVKPYGIREENNKRIIIFQVWDFADNLYELAMYFVIDDHTSETLTTHVMRTRYNAIGTDRLLALMREAGFSATILSYKAT